MYVKISRKGFLAALFGGAAATKANIKIPAPEVTIPRVVRTPQMCYSGGPCFYSSLPSCYGSGEWTYGESSRDKERQKEAKDTNSVDLPMMIATGII